MTGVVIISAVMNGEHCCDVKDGVGEVQTIVNVGVVHDRALVFFVVADLVLDFSFVLLVLVVEVEESVMSGVELSGSMLLDGSSFADVFEVAVGLRAVAICRIVHTQDLFVRGGVSRS